MVAIISSFLKQYVLSFQTRISQINILFVVSSDSFETMKLSCFWEWRGEKRFWIRAKSGLPMQLYNLFLMARYMIPLYLAPFNQTLAFVPNKILSGSRDIHIESKNCCFLNCFWAIHATVCKDSSFLEFCSWKWGPISSLGCKTYCFQ